MDVQLWRLPVLWISLVFRWKHILVSLEQLCHWQSKQKCISFDGCSCYKYAAVVSRLKVIFEEYPFLWKTPQILQHLYLTLMLISGLNLTFFHQQVSRGTWLALLLKLLMTIAHLKAMYPDTLVEILILYALFVLIKMNIIWCNAVRWRMLPKSNLPGWMEQDGE